MLTKVMFQYKDKRPHSNTKTTSYQKLTKKTKQAKNNQACVRSF